MFERFTDRARCVVVLGQEESRTLRHNYIGTEHLLAGLIHEGEGVAYKALESLGVTVEALRNQIMSIIGEGVSSPSGHIPFTPRCKKVLELSLREALSLGHSYIGTEHMLLGLIDEGEGIACQILIKLGVELNDVRSRVIAMLDGSYTSTPSTEADEPRNRPSPRTQASHSKRDDGSSIVILFIPGDISDNQVAELRTHADSFL
jgi:ATP-dependent Clp protease ATP-binding subunit ClpC